MLGVEEGPKPSQFILRVKDEQKPQILLQAPSVASRDEWVKILSLALEQRKARSVEDQMRGAGVDDVRSTSLQDAGTLTAAARHSGKHGSKRSSARKGADGEDGDGGAASAGPIVEPSTALEAEGDLPSDTMSKEAQEKFTRDMRLLVLEKDVAAVRRMLDPRPPRDALVWFYKDELGRTLLHLAVDTGDLKVADLIASADARLLELADQQGWLPLHLAAHKGSVEMGELLIKLGATIEPSDNHGRSPLYVALASGRVDFAKALIRRLPAAANWPAVLVAALGGVRAHLEKEAPVDVVHAVNKLTTLHLASCNASAAETVLYLIEQGLDVNRRDAHGKTSTHFASVSGALQPLRVLLAKGADPGAIDESKKVQCASCVDVYFRLLTCTVPFIIDAAAPRCRSWPCRGCRDADGEGLSALERGRGRLEPSAPGVLPRPFANCARLGRKRGTLRCARVRCVCVCICVCVSAC